MAAATLAGLPNAALYRICACLDDARDVARLGAVCRALRSAASDEGLWRSLCSRDYELSAPLVPGGGVSTDYRCVREDVHARL